MKTGTFETGKLTYHRKPEDPRVAILLKVSMTVYPTGFVEFSHYENGVKEPRNKVSLFLPATAVLSFEGYGYAN